MEVVKVLVMAVVETAKAVVLVLVAVTVKAGVIANVQEVAMEDAKAIAKKDALDNVEILVQNHAKTLVKDHVI